MTEFLVVMPAMLLLIFGAIQFFLVYQVKSTLNYAAFEAARAGSLHNASRQAVDNGFARGLAPVFARFAVTREDAGGNAYRALAEKVIDARDLALKEIEDGHVKIELLNPTPQMFQAFDNNTIPNDHLRYRQNVNSIDLRKANLLKIRITYCMKLIVPLVSNIINAAVGSECSGDEPRMPIVSTALIRMQSPAIQCTTEPCFDN